MRTKSNELTPCQLKTAQLLASGLSQKEIANALHRSTSTVSNTLRALYEKVGLNKDTEIVAYLLCKFHGASLDFDKIGKISRAVGATVLLMLFSIQVVTTDDNTMLRNSRRTRSRRNEDVELIKHS